MPGINHPEFDKNNIQGDIWPGLLKKYEIFCFFNIEDVSKFKPQLEKIANEFITSASRAQDMRGQTFEHKSALAKGKIEGPERLQIAGVNIAFNHKGLEKLGKTGLKDGAFSGGQFQSMVQNGRDQEHLWLDSFKKGVDGVLLICGEKDKVEMRLAQVEKRFLGESRGVKTVEIIRGEDLKGDKAGHEHFGFKDGIAQPQLEGLDDAKDNTPMKSFRHTPPGFIITGHGKDNEKVDWAKDGSYLVFRKLKQFVPEFKDFLQLEASRLGYTPGQLGARLVGRWESGAPVETNPDNDNPGDAEKDDFKFTLEDQSKCPFAAHIRKSRPRGDLAPFRADEAKFDIMRRGIPYGPEVTTDELNQKKTTVDRGLLFACYQSSLTNGFEFITKSWFNNPNFPPVNGVTPGADPIMTDKVKNSSEKLRMDILNRKGGKDHIDFDPFVESHGGSYFFMPSLAALREMAQAK